MSFQKGGLDGMGAWSFGSVSTSVFQFLFLAGMGLGSESGGSKKGEEKGG